MIDAISVYVFFRPSSAYVHSNNTLAAKLTLRPAKILLASPKIWSPWKISLFEYHVKKNFPSSDT